jgi:hypothetical protein
MMADVLASLANVFVDRSADELIAAVMIAVILALAMAGIYWIGRRKFSDVLMPMIVLMIVGNTLAMAVSAGYLMRARRRPLHIAHGESPIMFARGNPPLWPERQFVGTLFRVADTNRDGLLSPDEASQAITELVKKADSSGGGSVDADSLIDYVRAVERRDSVSDPFLRSANLPPASLGPLGGRSPRKGLRPALGEQPSPATRETDNPRENTAARPQEPPM